MDDLPQRVGRTIRRRREALGLSQEGLAALCDLSRTYIGEIERGDASATITTLAKVATALHVSVSELVSVDLDG